jgi:hypothetical protein
MTIGLEMRPADARERVALLIPAGLRRHQPAAFEVGAGTPLGDPAIGTAP